MHRVVILKPNPINEIMAAQCSYGRTDRLDRFISNLAAAIRDEKQPTTIKTFYPWGKYETFRPRKIV